MNHHRLDSLETVLLLGFLLTAAVFPVMAAAGEPPLNSQSDLPVATEKIPPASTPREVRNFFHFGYNQVQLDDVSTAGEYEDRHSSLSGGLQYAAYPLPNRFHLNGELLSEHNSYADAGYAYHDLLLFRDIFIGLNHNLAHDNYQYDGEPTNIRHTDRNPTASYYRQITDNFLTLRLKAPNFPFHLFLKHRLIDVDGIVQERFFIGNLVNINKVSRSRTLDWNSKTLTLGMNSHLGPLELEYTGEASQFDPGGTTATLYDFYPASATRPADVYPHNVVAETKSWVNTLKMHTSYTGQIVASATLDDLDQKNQDSLVESRLWHGAIDLQWMPAVNLGFFLKYRYQDRDESHPASFTLNGATSSTSYDVRPSVSASTQTIHFTTRYIPARKMTLLATYELKHTERREVALWPMLPESTDISTLKLSVSSRPAGNLNVKFAYDYQVIDDPAYNSQPDQAHYAHVHATYTPAPAIILLVNYDLTSKDRDHLRYHNNDPEAIIDLGNRQERFDRVLGSLTFLFSQQTTLTASWVYSRGKVKQHLAYGQWGDLPYIDPGVPYQDTANTFAVSWHHWWENGLTLNINASQTISDGKFEPGLDVAAEPVSIASFSSLEIHETELSGELGKMLGKDWEAGLEMRTNIYNDKIDNSQDSSIFTSLVRLKRFF